MQRTKKVIVEFNKLAKEKNAEAVYTFATEAVRSAKNKEEFISMLKAEGVDVDVVASKNEAIIGFYGAYNGGVKCVMDIGGASTEIAVGDKSGIKYAKSLPIGIVRIKDRCGEDIEKIRNFCKEMIANYGEIPQFDELLGIGGSGSTFAAIAMDMAVYDTKRVDNYMLTKDEILTAVNRLKGLTFEERLNVNGLHPKRRDIIIGSGILLMEMMDFLKVDHIRIRESDNLEGYLKYKLGEISLEK